MADQFEPKRQITTRIDDSTIITPKIQQYIDDEWTYFKGREKGDIQAAAQVELERSLFDATYGINFLVEVEGVGTIQSTSYFLIEFGATLTAKVVRPDGSSTVIDRVVVAIPGLRPLELNLSLLGNAYVEEGDIMKCDAIGLDVAGGATYSMRVDPVFFSSSINTEPLNEKIKFIDYDHSSSDYEILGRTFISEKHCKLGEYRFSLYKLLEDIKRIREYTPSDWNVVKSRAIQHINLLLDNYRQLGRELNINTNDIDSLLHIIN